MKRNRTTKLILVQTLVSMVIIAAFAFLFNFFPEKVGTYRTIGDQTTFTPMLTPPFDDHLLGLNLWWALGFVFNIFLLQTGRWTPALRWAEVALGLLGAYVLARLVISGPFLPAAGGEMVRYLLAFAVLGMLFDAVRKLNRLVNGRWLIFGSDPARE